MATTTPNLAPLVPSTPSTEWAARMQDILFSANGTGVETPGPAIPGAFPIQPASSPHSNGDTTILGAAKALLPAEDTVQRALTHAGQAAKAFLPPGVAGYFAAPPESATDRGAGSTTASSDSTADITADMDPAVHAQPLPTSETNVRTTANAGDSAPVLGDTRPPLSASSSALSGSSSVLSAASTIFATSASPQDEGYAPLASTASLVKGNESHLEVHDAVPPFTPIPPIALTDANAAYFPTAEIPVGSAANAPPSVPDHTSASLRAQGPSADASTRTLTSADSVIPASAKEGASSNKGDVKGAHTSNSEGAGDLNASDISVPLHTDAHAHANGHTEAEDAQRAVFSDPGFGVLGRDGDANPSSGTEKGAGAGFEAADSNADTGVAIFTAYGVHAPLQVPPSADDGDLDDDEVSPGSDGKKEKEKGRGSRFVAKLKEKMHVG
ncbi:hypothetical protein C8R44DRAFT_881414 [Mycena epipterygia]|nr:hypothetical protein C8R44DRAFT_881414 [Mycena epipterygia]